MKIKTRKLLCLLLIAAMLSSLVVHGDSPYPQSSEMRGMWVATVLNIDYPSKPTANPDQLRTEALNALDKAQSLGLNAVFLQVRPAADALYKSDYFPWSKYLTGKQGTAPDNGFDPLSFWVEEAHKRGIQLHAWVNPYRITKKTAAEPAQELKQLASTHPARLHPEWTVKHTDGNFYFNPGIPEVRQLVIDSSLELVTRYGVDGVHFDDYFYPGKDFSDAATYSKYGKGFANIDDWRRDNVNTLVRDLSKAIHAANPSARFGISPFGIWANSRTNPLGSDTRGLQSYYDHYADSLAWIKAGSIDYIAPQLYWNIGFDVADYSKLITWWKNAVAGTGVDLYVGHAAYRSGNSDASSPWAGTAEITRQLNLNAQFPEVKGSIFYNYKALAGNTALSSAIKSYYAGSGTASVPQIPSPVTTPSTAPAIQPSTATPAVPLVVGRPSDNIKSSLASYYLNGASDPAMPLFLNGVPVENRSSKGYFGVLVPLNAGVNTFTLTQGSSSVTRTITRPTASVASSAPNMSAAEIPAESAFPQAQDYRAPGEKITLSCKAPIGSTVTAAIGGKSYAMAPAATKAPGKGLYVTTFTCSYTLPVYSGKARVVDLGSPVYTMKLGKTTKTRKAPATVGVIMPGAPLNAIATQDVINTYDKPSSSDGASSELYNGMVDSVSAMTGNYIKLSSGKWVSRSGVRTYATTEPLNPVIKTVTYGSGAKWETLQVDISTPAAATAVQNGNVIKLSIALAKSGPAPVIPGDSAISGVTSGPTAGGLDYLITLKDSKAIDGFAVIKTPTGILLNLKKPVRITGGDLPLSGITVMLDPGHGGNDSGATGPLGYAYAEKTINLNNALALQTELVRNGATVLMTRTTDVELTLDQRLTQSRNARPDLFISIHANSMDNNVDISKISGFSAYYREDFAQGITQRIHDAVINSLSMPSKGVHDKNFYVTRGTWTPSILLEAGFVPNPGDFEKLTDPTGQAAFARTVTEAIVGHFAR